MKVFRLNIETNEKVFVEYPRKDMGKIDGLDANLKFYLVQDEDKPVYDSDVEELVYEEVFDGAMHPEYPAIHLAKGKWTVREKELPLKEEMQDRLKTELHEVVLEMSNLITAVKNLYYDSDTGEYVMPIGFKQLIKTVQQVRKRVISDIDNLSDSKSAAKFKIRTEEAEQLINEIKKYL